MIFNFYKKEAVFCAAWLLGLCSLQDLNASWLHENDQCLASKTILMQDIARATQNLAITTKLILHNQPAISEVSVAIDTLGNLLQAVINLKKNSNEETRSIKNSNKLREKTVLSGENADALISSLKKAANFSSVGEGSLLWLFRDGVIRVNRDLLLRHMLIDQQGRFVVLNELFSALRREMTPGVDAIVNAQLLPSAFDEIREMLQVFFGPDLWQEVFTEWINFVVDTAQSLMNVYIDMMQEKVDEQVDVYVQNNENPLLDMAAEQANILFQQQIDILQNQANQLIDQKLNKELVFNIHKPTDDGKQDNVVTARASFFYDLKQDMMCISLAKDAMPSELGKEKIV
ncbi:hypothetical protein FJ364_03490 [Candidatus Dependentiae bacterium]|nr:hypothetical protein [Candidatus Dependentiae bacterium]